MRLALVFKRLSLQDGTERHVYRLARDLLSHGHEVHLYCRTVDVELPRGLVVHRMPRIPLGELAGHLAFSAWVHHAVARTERRLGPFDIRHAFGRTLGQDIYRMGGGCHETYLEHAHALDYPFWLRRLLKGTPVQRLKRHLEARMLRTAPSPHVITSSLMSRDDLLHRYGMSPGRMHVVRNGVDLGRFRPPDAGEREAVRRAWGLDGTHEVALFIGTGYSRKGLDVALRTMRLLAADRPRLRLVVGGRDHRERRWRRLAERWGIGDRVLWLGTLREPEACVRGGDVSILPTAYDPAANSTLEALATGLPVVTSAMNGAAEILQDGVHGSVLSTPVHPSDLAAALVRWLGHPDRAAVARATRALAEDYPAGSPCASTLDVYRAFIEDRKQERQFAVGAAP